MYKLASLLLSSLSTSSCQDRKIISVSLNSKGQNITSNIWNLNSHWLYEVSFLLRDWWFLWVYAKSSLCCRDSLFLLDECLNMAFSKSVNQEWTKCQGALLLFLEGGVACSLMVVHIRAIKKPNCLMSYISPWISKYLNIHLFLWKGYIHILVKRKTTFDFSCNSMLSFFTIDKWYNNVTNKYTHTHIHGKKLWSIRREMKICITWV